LANNLKAAAKKVDNSAARVEAALKPLMADEAINAGLADPKMKARLAELGATTLPGSPADFGKLIADETEKWGKVVKFTGIRAD
jgi:tripartite-type tricarboxylate transporter receptor subunit TctC